MSSQFFHGERKIRPHQLAHRVSELVRVRVVERNVVYLGRTAIAVTRRHKWRADRLAGIKPVVLQQSV
eukprot:6617738-Heterocapsa_arctica.AAC.1